MAGSLTLAGVHSGACVIFAALFAFVDFIEAGALAAFGRVAFTGLPRFGVAWAAAVSAGVTAASGAVATFAAVAVGLRAGWVDGSFGAFSRLRL